MFPFFLRLPESWRSFHPSLTAFHRSSQNAMSAAPSACFVFGHGQQVVKGKSRGIVGTVSEVRAGRKWLSLYPQQLKLISSMITSLAQLDPNGSYTYADYLLWQFEERVELLRGRIRQMAAPSRKHQSIAGNMYRSMANALWKTPCKVYIAPFDVRFTRFDQIQNKEITTVLQPDLCVVCDPTKLDDRGCLGAPDMIAEVLSPGNSRTEMRDKFDIYQEAGVLEYWIISPVENTIQVWKLNEQGKYIGLPPAVEGDLLTTPIIPNLAVDLTEVFMD